MINGNSDLCSDGAVVGTVGAGTEGCCQAERTGHRGAGTAAVDGGQIVTDPGTERRSGAAQLRRRTEHALTRPSAGRIQPLDARHTTCARW